MLNNNQRLKASQPVIAQSWQGAYWKLLSCAAFAGINGIVRYLSVQGSETISPLSTEMMVFFQNLMGSLFLMPILLRTQSFKNIKTQYPIMHLIRIFTAVLGVYLWYLSIKYIPLAESVALSFTGPIFTVMGAQIILKEKMNKQCLLAIMLSILGSFIISRPDLAFKNKNVMLGLTALLPLSSALLLAWNKLLTRKLGLLGESPELLASFLLIFMVPISFIPAWYQWTTPTLEQCYWLLALGFLVAIAHLSFGKAYKYAEVTFLTPLGFSKFFFSTVIGYLAFSELPKLLSVWLGISIIFISILLLSSKTAYRSLYQSVYQFLQKSFYKINLYSIARRFKSN